MFGFGRKLTPEEEKAYVEKEIYWHERSLIYEKEKDMLEVKFKKMSLLAKDPVYMTNGACGADLYAATERVENGLTGPMVIYDTHLAIQIPKGYVGLLFPRSSISNHTTFALSNSVGVLDSDFTGSISFKFRNVVHGLGKKYNVGDRIGQIVIVPIPDVKFVEVEKLDETERKDGSYGSTGK